MVCPGREKLSGLVEVDETYVEGKTTGKQGRGAAHKTLVAIAVEDKG
ncbi:MAG: transposase [Spirochaetaceae bacterium]|nr:transposase [Spirochaetaceae bacterium]